jgi:hypothetical protein
MPIPQYTPKVFISHSSGNDPAAQRVRDALYDELKAQGFEPLVDRELEPSEGWRERIDDWLRECDAAVIIISQDALDSKYVFYEASNLHYRRTRYRNFVIIPILLPDISPELLRAKMDAVQLHELQSISLASKGTGEDAAVAAAVWEALEMLKRLLKRVFRHQLEEELVDSLSSRRFGNEDREAMWGLVSLNGPSGLVDKDQAFALARALLDMDVPRGEQRLERLKRVAHKLVSILAADTRRLINIITPFGWVDPEVALQIPLVAFGGGTARAVALRRDWELSVLMYLRRGCCRSKVHWVEISGSWSGDLLDDLRNIRRSLGVEVCYDNSGTTTIKRIKKRLEAMLKQGDAVFLLIPAQWAQSKLICMLHRLWPQLTVFLYDSELTREQLVEWGLEHVVFLEPPPNPDEEEQARLAWSDMMYQAGMTPRELAAGEGFEI